MIDKMYIYHDFTDYFGHARQTESELSSLYEEDIMRAAGKFARRAKEHRWDVLHINTDDRHYVICATNDGGMEWFHWYGPRMLSRTDAVPCTLADIRKMVRDEFKEA